MYLTLEKNTDQRRYNLPNGDMVAAIIPNQPSAIGRDIIVHRKDLAPGEPTFQRISETSPMYMPLQYPMLYPHGELGWTIGLQRTLEDNNDFDLFEEDGDDEQPNSRRKVTQLNYYAYELFKRSGSPNTVLYGRKLFQQSVVDKQAIVDQGRLNWVRFNQKTVRSAYRQGITDGLNEGADLAGLGVPVVLPASHTGSARNMFQKCQDSMTLLSNIGKQDLFITMTANPKWEEILSELEPGQQPNDRPDLIARVFHLKLKLLIKDLHENGFFGKTVARVYTIEFQKRGLPHAHILIWLAPEDKPRTSALIDKIVSAEIPNEQRCPELWKVVTTSMLHTQCNSTSTCWDSQRNRCSKGFPKPFQEETTINEDGYPTYRRRHDAPTFEKHGVIYTSQWVVPYNPWLSVKYQCHINVEICNTVQAVKYIHKYIFKGSDRATAVVERTGGNTEANPRDEIKKYLDSRYLGPHEACWRLFQFKMHQIYPSIFRLPVHLPEQESILFHPDDTEEEIRARLDQVTKLQGFFEYNTSNPNSPKYLYATFPQHFTWHPPKGRRQGHWEPRKQGFSYGRMPWVSPRTGERYYLRYLLSTIPGMIYNFRNKIK